MINDNVWPGRNLMILMNMVIALIKDNNGNPVSSGVYLYQLHAGNFSQVKKMILLR